MKIPQIIPALIIAVLILHACTKKTEDPKDDNQGSNKTKKELISQKRWKITSLISGQEIWNTPFVEACSKDNEYLFRADDSLVLFDMASKCNSSDPDSTVSSYQLYNGNQIILNVKLTNMITLNDTADIIELNETTLKINAEYSTVPATITFSHP